MPSKICFKCGETKPLEDFYPHKKMADGHLNKCKTCTREDVRAHELANPEQVKATQKLWESRPENRIRKVSRMQAYRRNNPEKFRAHSLLNSALRCGRITKEPCQRCGNVRSEAHHRDYSKPLDVIWLCSKHHKEAHRVQF